MPAIAQPVASADTAFWQGYWAGCYGDTFSTAYLAYRAEFGVVAREHALSLFRGWHTGRTEAAEARRDLDAGEDRPWTL